MTTLSESDTLATMANAARKKPRKQKPVPSTAGRVIVYASLSAEDADRLDAFAESEADRTGAIPRRGTYLVQLMRKGLAAVEAGS